MVQIKIWCWQIISVNSPQLKNGFNYLIILFSYFLIRVILVSQFVYPKLYNSCLSVSASEFVQFV